MRRSQRTQEKTFWESDVILLKVPKKGIDTYQREKFMKMRGERENLGFDEWTGMVSRSPCQE